MDRLRPRSAAVLAALVARRGRIVSKDELIAAAWPSPAVTDESVAQCIADIRRAIGDRDRTLIETHPKRGYRLALPERTHGRRVPLGAAALILVLLLVGAVLMPRNPPGPVAAADRPSLAVLPFEDRGGGILADGFAEDLTIALVTLSALDVVPSAITQSLDETDRPAGEIAEALGARYLLDGSLRRHGGGLQVTAELMDAPEGRVIWAGAYDGAPEQLFEFHDEILGALVEALSLTLSEEERARMAHRGGGSLAAYEEMLRGRHAAAELTRMGNLRAERHFRRALEILPDYARAHAGLADVHVMRLENGWSSLPAADEQRAMFYARRARALDPDMAYAEYVLGRLHAVGRNGSMGQSAAHLRRAMELAPGDDDARVFYAVTRILDGAPEEALTILEAAIAGHPAPPFWYHLAQGHALIHLDRAEEALDPLGRCLEQMPTAPYCLRYRIVAEGAAGRADDALWTAAEYEALGFEASVSAIMPLFIDKDEERRERLREGLRAAGLPENDRGASPAPMGGEGE